MKICLLFPGKIKPAPLLAAQELYGKRLKAYGVECMEYRDEKVSANAAEQAKKAEAERILKLLKPGDYLIACDERGRTIHTAEIVSLLKASTTGDQPLTGKSRIVMVIGGAMGLSESIRERADAVWQLSGLVMAGGVARIVLLEAVYRAFTILNQHPYHNA
jgi:23S rRNA (pseudouridine1915-N3)-methyltransferase